ncbi:DNA repair protein RecO [Candidatus Mycoplasma mahonii]|uniref:DNA repair protein RecO n=1 Tax=Candidatus Mycoplasma mahonii TaxID=3004105 RepID=UPI0026F14861|nr:DNA repair protein RecO [Candidatus Mycoplasma mahonii]WKX02790.1 DNA repair protein RecO [Candidatus Mycoplasma mahonii]
MSETKEVGIVVKMLDYDDYDQIITIITSTEVIGIIALGVRKINSKNRVALQLGNIIEVELFRARLNGKLSKLKRANIIKQPPILELDTAEVLLEIVGYLVKVKDSPKNILSMIFESFPFLGTQYNHHVKTYIMFHYLNIIGQMPTSHGCIECGSLDHIDGFEFYQGGFTCKRHIIKSRDLEFLKAIQSIGHSFIDYKTVDASTNKLVFAEIKDFISRSNW